MKMPNQTTVATANPQTDSTSRSRDIQPCRFCGGTTLRSFVDLGMSPLCESFVAADDLDRVEAFYPLHAFVCEDCFLVQVPEFVSGEEIFGGEYAYFSSFSDAWLKHARDYASMITARLGLGRIDASDRARQQRRLPAAELRQGRSPLSGHRAGGQRRGDRRKEGCPDTSTVLRHRNRR